MSRMEAVAGVNHLYRRGAVYWFRRRVPDDVAGALGLTQWRVSLGTKDHNEAKRLVRLKSVETDRLIDVARARNAGKASLPMSKGDADRMAVVWMADVLAFDEAFRVGSSDTHSATRWMEEAEGQYREDLANLNTAAVAKEVDQTLAREGLWYPPADPSRTLLGVALLKAQVRLLGLMQRRLAGEVVEVNAPEPTPLSGDRPTVGGTTVKQLLAAYSAERFARSTPEERKKFSHLHTTLETILGPNTAIRGITRADVRALRDLLQRLPKFAGRRYPGLTPAQAADRADSDGAERISGTTVNAYLADLVAALNWAVREELIDKNPAKGIVQEAEPTVVRRSFTTDELRRIFAGLQPYALGDKAWRFWVPAMALYSGARASELATLRVGDLSVTDGIQCMSFSQFDERGVRIEGKRLKTKASERRVPVHQALIDAGLLDYVATLDKAPETRLFAALPPGPNGNYSHDLSKFFGRFRKRKDINVTDPATVFHSFRHGFADACRDAGVPEEQRLMLGGWTIEGEGSKYGDRGRLKLLARELAKVNFTPFVLPKGNPEQEARLEGAEWQHDSRPTRIRKPFAKSAA